MTSPPTAPVLLAAATITLFVVPLAARPVQEDESTELLVLAASSLADVLPAVADAWRAEGGVEVRFSFDATSRLAPQAFRGAPGDVFFSADRAWMDWLLDRGGVEPESVRDFLGNELVAVVPTGAMVPAVPEDLTHSGRLALAGENVPAGRYARDALEAAGVWERLEGRIVRGGSVRGTLEWVARGDVDAGVVYRTDALSEEDVVLAFAFPAEGYRPIRYPVGVLATSSHPGLAEEFLDFCAGPAAAEIFSRAGFVLGDGSLPSVDWERGARLYRACHPQSGSRSSWRFWLQGPGFPSP